MPLLIFTADRPTECHDVSANQSIKQDLVFSDYVVWKKNFEAPSLDVPASYIPSSISYAISLSLKESRPVHFNLQFREPFNDINSLEDFITSSYLSSLSQWWNSQNPLTIYSYQQCMPKEADIIKLNDRLSNAKKGLIICGELTNISDAQSALELGEKLKWPLIPDILSGLRLLNHDCIFPNLDVLIRDGYEPDYILHIGGRLLDKNIAKNILKCHVLMMQLLHFLIG